MSAITHNPVGPWSAPDRMPNDDPRKELMIGAALAGALVLGFGGWAVTTRLDAAVIGQGVVRIDEARQVIQAPQSGVVSSVPVHNGDHVRRGDMLVAFADVDAVAQERAMAARTLGLEAEIARLEAELANCPAITVPARFATLTGDDRRIADDAMRMAQAQFEAGRALEASERGVLADRGAQIGHQIDGYRQRLLSSRRQSELSNEELASYRTLYQKGLATKPRLLALERSVAAIDGDTGAAVTEIARLHSAAGEARLQLVQARSERSRQSAERLRAAQTEFATALPQWQATAEQLRRTVVRAPSDGVVTALRTRVPGAVLQAGAPLLEIVPERGALSVETRVSVADANDLRPGQAAEVKLSVLHGRLLPPVKGVVSRVSADSQEDEKTGQPYYTATVRLSAAELNRVARMGEVEGGVRAGTPVEVVVATKPRSALGFLLGPLTSRLSGTFSQR